MWGFLGSLLGAGSSLLGGLMGQQSANKAARLQQIQAEENREMQEEFAQQGVRWRVIDAKRAGIHPLAALGAQLQSYQPVQIGSTFDNSLGTGIAAAGQDLGRALQAAGTAQERVSGYEKTVQDLTLQRMGLENQILASQLAKQTGQLGPPMPALNQRYVIDGQGSTAIVTPAAVPTSVNDQVSVQPVQVPSQQVGQPAYQAGLAPETQFMHTPTGGFAPVMTPGAADATEDDAFAKATWHIRNRIPAMFGFGTPPTNVDLPAGKKWVFNWATQEWQMKDKDWGDRVLQRPSAPMQDYSQPYYY